MAGVASAVRRLRWRVCDAGWRWQKWCRPNWPAPRQRWLYYDELRKGYRAWLGDLPSDVARGIAWGNGASLFGVK